MSHFCLLICIFEIKNVIAKNIGGKNVFSTKHFDGTVEDPGHMDIVL